MSRAVDESDNLLGSSVLEIYGDYIVDSISHIMLAYTLFC